MIARFELNRQRERFRFLPLSSLSKPDPPQQGSARRAYRLGLGLIALLTLWLLAWLCYRWLAQPAWTTHLPALVQEMIALLETAAAFTLAFLWAALGWRYWQQSQQERQLARTPSLHVEKLQTLSPRAFERYVAGLFRQKGYTVLVRGRSGDLGVDLELTAPGGRKAIVQCKRYQNTVGAEVVRELFGTLIHERVSWAFLVTTADISDAAREWAQGKPITLIDGATLVRIAGSLRRKMRT